MIKIIRNLLESILNDIDTGNTNISEEELNKIIELFLNINRNDLSKTESANYIGVSRATFDNYIQRGWIPQGKKRLGFKELSWNKSDLNKFLKERHDKCF